MRKILYLLFICPLCYFLVSCNASPTAPSEESPENGLSKIEETLVFKGVRPAVHPPCQVQFFFSLRDKQERAVVMEPGDLAGSTRIFENNTEIDYSETNFFVTNADNFRMDIVLVMDFTNSMASFNDNDSTAIDQMILGSKEIIRAIGSAHRIAMIEFHDRNFDSQVLSHFTSDTTFLIATLDAFAGMPIDHGSTRVWDAVYKGLELFPDVNNPDDVRLVIFLSDGFDTSSRFKPENIIELAKKKFVQINSVGIGRVLDATVLQNITNSTEGLYYPAEKLSDIFTQLSEIAKNLRGQYKLSYISLLQESKPEVKIQIEYKGGLNSFAQIIDLTVFREGEKDDRIGRLTYDGAVVANERATAILRLEHTPRNINAFKFNLQSGLLQRVEIIHQVEGGLLDPSWQLTASNDGWFLLQSNTNVLPFGAFGLLVKAHFAPISGSGLKIPFAMDNTIYSGGKSFEAPDTLRLGLAITNPSPAHGSINISRQPIFTWAIGDANQSNLTFDIHLDTFPLATALVSANQRAKTFSPAQPLLANKTYYWKIVVQDGRNHYTGPIWKFTTGSE
jgi:hypothetical protein